MLTGQTGFKWGQGRARYSPGEGVLRAGERRVGEKPREDLLDYPEGSKKRHRVSNETQGSSRKKQKKAKKNKLSNSHSPARWAHTSGKPPPGGQSHSRVLGPPRGGSHPKTHTPFSPRAPFLGR